MSIDGVFSYRLQQAERGVSAATKSEVLSTDPSSHPNGGARP